MILETQLIFLMDQFMLLKTKFEYNLPFNKTLTQITI